MTRTTAGVLGVLVALAGGVGCPHMDGNRILSYHEASFEGGYEVALLQQRTWSRDKVCGEVDYEDNEMWLVWSHIATAGEFGDAFEIGEQIELGEAWIAAAEDAKRVYYSLGTFAEIADRYGNIEAKLGSGRRSAAFQPGRNILVIEADGGFELVDLNEGTKDVLPVVGAHPSFSPDGAYLTYVREGEVWHYHIATMSEESLGAGYRPRYREDGMIYAFLADGAAGPGLYEVDPGVGTWLYIGDPDPAAVRSDFYRLAPDGKRVLFHDGEGGYVLRQWAGPGSDDWSLGSELWCE